MYSQGQVVEIVQQTIDILESRKVLFSAPVGVSNRHIHLSPKDVETLFGKGHELTEMRPLSQPNQYAAKETLVVAGPKGAITKVRVLGPTRDATQVELLRSDSFVLGIELPVMHSGSNAPSPEVTLIGPKGTVVVNRGVMAAWRHIHMSKDFAMENGYSEGDTVSVRTKGVRSVTYDNVKIRLGEYYNELHIDVDEANAAYLSNGDEIEAILK